MHWMKIWWTNTAPLVSQSDPGTENYGLANGHTLLRHLHDPSLEGTLQHRWMVKKKNDILDVGVNNGWYNPDILLEVLVFRYVFIPWLQQELDAYRDRINNTAKRADRNKILPHGVPNDIYEHPSDYGVLDFKVINSSAQIRNLYAPKDHEVFQLVPPDFAAIVSQMYVEIGQPPVTRQSCWDIYLQLLNCFHTLDDIYNIPTDVDAKWGYALTLARDDYAKEIELLPNLRPLRNGDSVIGPGGFCYMGGVNNGDGLDAQQCAHLDEMLNNDEPQIENDDDPQIFACFSDEEFTGPDEVDEW
ncbi:hypothetical protein B0H14DRAFT_3096030 [Mycena olivaceomarginata]|nr:hypothetical protein B0H14DRAFT_3096030 [Mycena olivaceomarginata]